MTASVIKRRLRSHREEQEHEAQRKTAAEARRLDRERNMVADMAAAAKADIPLALYRATIAEPRAVPMAAFYARDKDFEKARGRFYAYCAMIFGSDGWVFTNSAEVVFAAGAVGFGGAGRLVAPLDQESAASINVVSAPLEWMVARGFLQSADDDETAGMMRYAVALRFRNTLAGAQVSPLKSQNLEGGGGGGGSGRPVSDYKLDCIREVNRLREALTWPDYQLLEQVLFADEWVWRKHRSRKKRALATLAIHRAIDRAGVVFGMNTEEQVSKRWARRPRSGALSSAA